MALAAFTLNGTRYELSSDVAEARLAGVAPGPIREHAVQVNGVWYPVKQAFEVAVGVPRSEFLSHTARRHLATLGFPLQGQIESRDGALVASETAKPGLTVDRDLGGEEWHTEANVQASVVTALAARGYRILSVANTATKEHGIDVIASRYGATVGVEVKGYPSRNYARPSSRERTQEDPAKHPGRPLVCRRRPRRDETAWQGARVEQRYRTSRL